jgi:hypothetical protein
MYPWCCPGSVGSFSSSFLDLFSINLTPQAQPAAEGGRSSRGFSRIRRKSTAYDSITAAIAPHPWPLVPPEIEYTDFPLHEKEQMQK